MGVSLNPINLFLSVLGTSYANLGLFLVGWNVVNLSLESNRWTNEEWVKPDDNGFEKDIQAFETEEDYQVRCRDNASAMDDFMTKSVPVLSIIILYLAAFIGIVVFVGWSQKYGTLG